MKQSEYPETALLQRFEAATGLQFVQAHYAGFPLDAKILKDGKTMAVAQVAIKKCRFAEHTHFMQTIWKLELGKDATAEHRVPYWIICKFADCDALYEFSSDHKFERRDGKGKPPNEQRTIALSVFIPMMYFKKFEQWKWKPKAAPKMDENIIEVDL